VDITVIPRSAQIYLKKIQGWQRHWAVSTCFFPSPGSRCSCFSICYLSLIWNSKSFIKERGRNSCPYIKML